MSNDRFRDFTDKKFNHTVHGPHVLTYRARTTS